MGRAGHNRREWPVLDIPKLRLLRNFPGKTDADAILVNKVAQVIQQPQKVLSGLENLAPIYER